MSDRVPLYDVIYVTPSGPVVEPSEWEFVETYGGTYDGYAGCWIDGPYDEDAE